MDIQEAKATDLTDCAGAAQLLTAQFGRDEEHAFSVESIHQLVKQNKLRAFMFDQGMLVERQSGASTRGKDLLFLRTDLAQVPTPGKAGRPHGSTKKKPGTL